MVRVAALAIFLLASTVVPRAQSQNPVVDARQLEAFRAQLRRASQSNDRHAIAAMIRYPITVSIGGFRVPFADAESFVERYDDIFNPLMRDAIARHTGTDFIVVAQVEGQLQITSITVPRFEGGGGTAAIPATETPKGTARKPEPRRVAIRVGPRPTQIPGLLARDTTDALILFLPKGKLASVRLERVPAGTAVVRVVHARTGTPLNARTSADGRFVSGRPTEGAEYRIEVQRIGNADEAYLPYMLSLSLR